MSLDLTRWDRHFRRALLGSAAVLAVADYALSGANLWVRSGFVVVMAGCVGYFTNFLAIKMLFQPRRGQVLGWRGLIPRNQAEIARSLGESVQSQLLAPDIVLGYIHERQLVERGTRALAEWLDANLQRPEVRREITASLIRGLNARGEDLLRLGFDTAEAAAKRIARNPQVIELYWQRLRAALTEFLAETANRELVVGMIRRVLHQQMPTVARWVDRAIETFLQEKNVVGRVGLGLKSLLSLDRAAIERLLLRFVEDGTLANEVLLMLDAIMRSVQADLSDEAKQSQLQAELERWISTVSTLSRRHVLPATAEQLGAYLNEPGNWAQIEEGLIAGLQWLKDRAAQLLASETGQRYLRAGIERAVSQLNVTRLVEQQINKLDSDDLEKLVLNNTGGNLTVIQLLGGAIGLIVGTVQVHLLFALPLGVGLAAVWLAWHLNARRHRDD